MEDRLELFLFTSDPAFARRAETAGIDSIILDWECRGKADRQHGQDMEINADTPEAVERVAAAVRCPVTVRVNALGPDTAREVGLALDCGARMLMLPMAVHPDEVARFLNIVAGRARTIVQVETQPLVERVSGLAALPWDYVYIGLHDLMLSRRARSMWQAVLDGTVERVFRALAGRAVGFAGVTAIGGGYPIRFTLLLQELARLGARASFLRRTFRREILDRDMSAEIAAVRAAWVAGRSRGPQAIAADHAWLVEELRRLAPE